MKRHKIKCPLCGREMKIEKQDFGVPLDYLKSTVIDLEEKWICVCGCNLLIEFHSEMNEDVNEETLNERFKLIIEGG